MNFENIKNFPHLYTKRSKYKLNGKYLRNLREKINGLLFQRNPFSRLKDNLNYF